MDLILGRFADAALAGLEPSLLEAFDKLLSENDHELYRWVAGSEGVPTRYEEIIDRIRGHHRIG
jgi:antitoxin CptB